MKAHSSLQVQNFFSQGPRALLLLNGFFPNASRLNALWKNAIYKVAADGAVLQLNPWRLVPDVVIGDMDSLVSKNEPMINLDPKTEKIFLADQETTDAEKAIDFLITKGFTLIDVVGFLGDRLDHTLNHFRCLGLTYEKKVQLFFWTDSDVCFLMNRSFVVEQAQGRRMAVIPYPKSLITNFSGEGLAFNFQSAHATFAGFSSIANTVVAEQAKINMEPDALVFVVLEHPDSDFLQKAV